VDLGKSRGLMKHDSSIIYLKSHFLPYLTNRLMLFRETIVCCENDMKYANILCGQNAEFFNVGGSGTCSYHCALTFRHRNLEMVVA
jgi:hypothetical protein